MAVVSQKPETSMSSEAFDLINCFYDGVDVLVRELAEQIATRDGCMDGETVMIEKSHVEEAGCKVVESVKQLLNDKKIPKELEERFKGMTQCFSGE